MLKYIEYIIYNTDVYTDYLYTKPSFNILYQKMLDILGSYS